MAITTEILYKCLRELYQKNEKNINKKNDSKRVRHKEFSEKKNNDKRIKLIDLFPQYLVDGKLLLKNINMYRLVFSFKNDDFYVRLKDINFENCIFEDCDFSYLWLDPIDFENASFRGNCSFEGTYVSEKKQQGQERKMREDSWLLKIHETYPEDYYRYENHIDDSDKPSYRFNDSLSNSGIAKYLGWKLHLSVHPTDISKAFELAAPIISRYGYSFKMINSKLAFRKGARFDGAQFTIYLEEDNQLRTTVEKTRKMMNELAVALSSNHIRVGEIPDSDAPSIFKYFSFRNDRFDFDDLFVGSTLSMKGGVPGYLLSRFVGENYNPLNRENPFMALIIDKNSKFNLAEHFNNFKPKNYHEASIAYVASLCAWLNEYTYVFELSPLENARLKKICFSTTAKVDAHIFKSEKNATAEFSGAVKIVLRYLSWLNQSAYLNNHFFPLSSEYIYKNAFSAALFEMESKVVGFENSPDYEGNADISYPRFLEQNLYKEASAVEQEGGGNNPQELGLSHKDRIRDYSLQSPHHTRPVPKP